MFRISIFLSIPDPGSGTLITGPVSGIGSGTTFERYRISNQHLPLTNECLLMLGLNRVLPLLDHSLCDVHVQWSRVSKIPEKIAIHSYWNHVKTR
jgi:hypothetical protein